MQSTQFLDEYSVLFVILNLFQQRKQWPYFYHINAMLKQVQHYFLVIE